MMLLKNLLKAKISICNELSWIPTLVGYPIWQCLLGFSKFSS